MSLKGRGHGVDLGSSSLSLILSIIFCFFPLEFPYDPLNLFPFFVFLSPLPHKSISDDAREADIEEYFAEQVNVADVRCVIRIRRVTAPHHCIAAISLSLSFSSSPSIKTKPHWVQLMDQRWDKWAIIKPIVKSPLGSNMCLHTTHLLTISFNETMELLCSSTSLSSSFALSSALFVPRSFSVSGTRRFMVVCSSEKSQKENQMTVSVTGATGFIGRRLVQRLRAGNHSIRVLTRSKSKVEQIFPAKDFPGIVIAEEPDWKNCVQGSTAVVNLAGLPISTRWSPEIKKEIKESRIRVTSKVVELMNNALVEARPTVLVSATAVGYYGTSETQVFDENSPSGKDYLAEVCREWEGTALKANKDVRVALIRIGVVLGKDGGALAMMIPFFQMFAGGPLGTGQQWFSWIHVDDLVSLIYEALTNPSFKGVINGTAPNPVRFGEMCQQLGSVLSRPSWLPVPEFALKALLGEGATVVLEGQKVLPARAKELGFEFKYKYVKDALRAIMQ